MSNLGKAIYMACFALMFVFAATTSIYLYGTLNTYLDSSTTLTTIGNRTENATEIKKEARKITRSEIYITLFNMQEMHIDQLQVYKSATSDPYTVVLADVLVGAGETGNGDLDGMLDYINESKTREFTYKYSIVDNKKTAIYITK